MNDGFVSDEDKPSLKDKIGSQLTDRSSINFITFIQSGEEARISAFKALLRGEDAHRRNCGAKNPHSLLSDLIDEMLQLRTSLRGWRATQLKDVVAKIVEDQQNTVSNPFERLGKVIR